MVCKSCFARAITCTFKFCYKLLENSFAKYFVPTHETFYKVWIAAPSTLKLKTWEMYTLFTFKVSNTKMDDVVKSDEYV